MLQKLTIEQIEVQGKRVFCRVDFNVPLENGQITDDTRIRAALPTIRHLRDKGAEAVLLGCTELQQVGEANDT